MCACKGRNFANIVSRRHFDNVHSYQVDSHEPADNRHRLVRGQPATNRRTRAGRIARIQAVDVKSQINGFVANYLPGLANNSVDAVLLNPGTVEDVESQRIFIACA